MDYYKQILFRRFPKAYLLVKLSHFFGYPNCNVYSCLFFVMLYKCKLMDCHENMNPAVLRLTRIWNTWGIITVTFQGRRRLHRSLLVLLVMGFTVKSYNRLILTLFRLVPSIGDSYRTVKVFRYISHIVPNMSFFLTFSLFLEEKQYTFNFLM